MKYNLLFSLILSVFGMFSASAQGADTIPPDWKLKAIYGLNGTQSSFVNWVAGGRNNISVLGYVTASAKYEKNTLKWDNDLGLALGGLQYLDAGSSEGLQKTDDRIELASNFGYRLKRDKNWFLSLIGGFRTQFLDGFATETDTVRSSTFMAPGYVNLALGIDYTPNDNFSVFISPLASKLTFVRDQNLADAGSFGVDAAVLDQTTGDVVTRGKMFRGEFGAYFKMKYNKVIAKNIDMKTKLDLFSNYVENPENIDVNAEVMFNFRVNSWFSASLNWNLLYDHDIIQRTQFKSVLGLGISYTMRNFKE